MAFLGVFPISLWIGGDFFESSTGAKICILKPMKDEGSSKEILKRNLIALMTMFIMIFFTVYGNKKVAIFIKGIFPNVKMSCIGRYKRNTIDYEKARTLSLCSYIIFMQSSI